MGRSYLKYLRLFSCNFPYSEYKGLNQRSNCTKYKLFHDLAKKPISETIKAPYNQGNVVLMTLCALTYLPMKE